MKTRKNLNISWDGCGEFIRFWHEGKQYPVPEDEIKAIQEEAVRRFKCELKSFLEP